MKLTKTMKENFVFKALKDIPEIDYKEQWRKLVLEIASNSLPADVKKIWDKNETKPYLNIKSIYLRDFSCMGYVAAPMPESDSFSSLITPEYYEKLKTIHDSFAAQRDNRNKARDLLESAINSVNTLKQAKEALPEFIKYLPEENEKSQLPAMISANIVADLKAIGMNINN